MLKKIITLIILPFCIVIGRSQDLSLLGSGGDMTFSENLYLSFSIGEPCIQETQNGSQWMTEGFQQPESIHLMVGIHETEIAQHIRIFPNPTSATITIHGIDSDQPFEIRLLNQLGQLVFTHRFGIHEEPVIGMENLIPGLYWLNLRSSSSSLFAQSITKL